MATEKVVQTIAEMIPGDLPADADTAIVQSTEIYRHDIYVPNGRTRATLEIPEQLTEEVPLVIVPGFGGIKPAYRRLREAAAQNGRATVTARPIRDLKWLASYDPRHLLHPEILPRQTTERVIEWACDFMGTEHADVVAHSMGGSTATATTEHNPDLVRSLLLMASAGMEDHDIWTMRRRIRPFFKEELLPNLRSLREENEAKMAVEALYYFFRNPLRTALEAVAVSGCDIRGRITNARTNGIPVGALQFANDKLFDLSNVKVQSGHLVDLMEIFDDYFAGHMAPQLHAAKVGEKVVSIVDRLNHPEDLPVAA